MMLLDVIGHTLKSRIRDKAVFYGGDEQYSTKLYEAIFSSSSWNVWGIILLCS